MRSRQFRMAPVNSGFHPCNAGMAGVLAGIMAGFPWRAFHAGPPVSGVFLSASRPPFPVLCIYATPGHPAAALALPDAWERFDAGLQSGPNPALTALHACAAAWSGRDVLLLHGGCELPPMALQRLAAVQSPAHILFPLSNALLDPRPEGHTLSTDAADACVLMQGGHEAIACEHWLPACALWRAEALTSLASGQQDGLLPFGLQAAAFDALFVHSPLPAPQPPGEVAAISALRARIAALDGRIPLAAGRDARPVRLHVLHGWGGGVQRFVEDLMRTDTAQQHLALVARGEPSQYRPGQRLELYDDLRQPALASWPLACGIATTAAASEEYDRVLDQVLARYKVTSILVSSLIGHGLSVLRRALPTACVFHDYYPLWPRLHEDFGDAGKDFSSTAIATALSEASASPFGETRASVWQALREAFVTTLVERGLPLLTPSHSTRANLCRIEPRLAGNPWHVIPHGLATWPVPWVRQTPPPRERLRVLVLGRVGGGKGETLLAALAGKLDPRIELLLLGAGREGMRFFGQAGFHVQMNYQRDALPALLQPFAPDLALIPASVAETFSYTLSELWSLQIPVLATALGSLAERIEDGRSGLLVAADADAIAARLNALVTDRSVLQKLQAPPPISLEHMAAAYRAAFAPAPTQDAPPALPAPDPNLSARHHYLEVERNRLSERLDQARDLMASQRREMERRAHWAEDMQALAEARTEWARSLEADLNLTRDRYFKLDEAYNERDRQARHLEQEMSNAVAHGETMQRERDALLASRSWRLTRPLRYAVRLLAQWRTRMGYHFNRSLTLTRRVLKSLRTRGLAGTWQRLRDELRRPLPDTVPLTLPEAIDPDQIILPNADEPLASIVIPVYNHLDATLTCLQSLAQTRNRSAFEVILVDDASSDDSAHVLPTIRGLRYQRNAENLGFIGACNAGAANARAPFIVFLNNDTAVQNGWLDALLDTFASHRDVGLVGAKLVYPDGRLQEAGGIVFADGSGWNYGRFDDPARPEYNFVREVDYCSGAAIALRTALLRELGGFDSHYAPAYYEDTDLAMKVRQAGLRVMYQPASVVVHFEGISSGTDTHSGTKRYQVINKEKFLARWQDVLATTHPAPSLATSARIVEARQHRQRKRILVIDATTPQPDHDSGSLRLCNILRLLLEEGHAVSFFADNRAFVEPYSSQLQQMGVEVLWHPFLSNPASWFEQNGRRFDLILISRHYIAASYVNLIRNHARQARLAFDTVDLHYLREQRAAELSGNPEDMRIAQSTRDKELALVRESDVTLVVSPVEKALLEREVPGARVEILSNVHEVFGRRRGFAERAGLMFVGGYQHPPNIDAAIWFTQEILPLVRAELPEVELHLIGSKAPPEVQALGQLPGVIFHGFVAELEPFLDQCRLAVAPLRYGAGVKGKVNMSMSYGQPVIATGIAVEGMFAEPGRDVLVAETPQEFAAQIIRAYRDEVLWLSLSEHGLANVREHFSFDSARTALRSLFNKPDR